MKNLRPFIFMLTSLMVGIVISCKEEEIPVATEVTIKGFDKTLAENPAHQTVLGQVVATTTQGSLTYALTEQNPAGAMDIDASTGEVTVADTAMFDFETHTELEATASASADGVTRTAEILIKLTDVDEATADPVMITDLTLSIDENPSQGQVLDTLEATSGTGTLSYSLVSQTIANSLEVNASSGELTVDDATVFDFETNPTLEAQVAATNGTDSDTATVTINLVDVDEAVFSVQAFSTSIPENSPKNTVLGKVTVNAAQGAVSYQITEQSVAGAVSINANGELLIADSTKFDYESSQSITGKIEATEDSKSSTADFTIHISDISITAADLTADIDENPSNAAVISKLSVQPDTSAITYAILSQSVAGSVSINSAGELVVADANKFDYETIQSITGQYTAILTGEMDTASFTVNIQDVSEATVAATDFTATVDENIANGTVIGTVSANITSGTGTLTYSIVSQSVSGPVTIQSVGSAVSINANGELIVNDASEFDYELQTKITGTYRAAVGTSGDDASFTININDIDDRVVTAQDFTVSIDENSANGTRLGAPILTMTGGSGSFVYSILSQSVAGAIGFDVNGAFEVTDVNAFDYETNTQITGTYQVEVSGSTSPDAIATANFTININDKYSWEANVFAGIVNNPGSSDGTGTSARFNLPLGMDFDASGNLYVADYGNNRIRKIDANGDVTTLAGTTQGFQDGAGNTARFHNPRDVEIDGNGNLWVADNGNQRLRRITLSTGWTSSPGGVLGFNPNGLTIKGNSVFVSYDHKIQEWDISLNRITANVVGGGTVNANGPGYRDGFRSSALFNSPRGMAVAANGDIVVADLNNKYVRYFGTGNFQTATNPGAYFGIADVEVAPDGSIYAVESGNQRIRIVTSSTTAAEEVIIGSFGNPSGIAIHPTTGDIYVSDLARHCIYKVSKVQE